MKALHLNLASRPYRDYRPLWIVVGVTVALALVLLVNNVRTAYRFFVNTRDTRAEIARVEQATRNEKSKAATIEDEISRLDTHTLEMRVRFVNEEIAERAFSWSALLDRLEKVVPGDVRIVTLAPTIKPDSPVALSLTCIAKTDDGLVEMIRALIADPHFTSPFPGSESLLTDGQHQFTLHMNYAPDPEGTVK